MPLNPLYPAVVPDWQEPLGTSGETLSCDCADGMHRIGHAANHFCFDNETPAHQVYLHPHAIASRLVRNRDWLDFMRDGGYRTPSLWMSDGWATVQS